MPIATAPLPEAVVYEPNRVTPVRLLPFALQPATDDQPPLPSWGFVPATYERTPSGPVPAA
ncbi:hypothetical protein WI95_28135 [Burkholderia contaminans]|nr:hypothetical protein WI95_28135 [Burkholderia contaminans]